MKGVCGTTDLLEFPSAEGLSTENATEVIRVDRAAREMLATTVVTRPVKSNRRRRKRRKQVVLANGETSTTKSSLPSMSSLGKRLKELVGPVESYYGPVTLRLIAELESRLKTGHRQLKYLRMHQKEWESRDWVAMYLFRCLASWPDLSRVQLPRSRYLASVKIQKEEWVQGAKKDILNGLVEMRSQHCDEFSEKKHKLMSPILELVDLFYQIGSEEPSLLRQVGTRPVTFSGTFGRWRQSLEAANRFQEVADSYGAARDYGAGVGGAKALKQACQMQRRIIREFIEILDAVSFQPCGQELAKICSAVSSAAKKQKIVSKLVQLSEESLRNSIGSSCFQVEAVAMRGIIQIQCGVSLLMQRLFNLDVKNSLWDLLASSGVLSQKVLAKTGSLAIMVLPTLINLRKELDVVARARGVDSGLSKFPAEVFQALLSDLRSFTEPVQQCRVQCALVEIGNEVLGLCHSYLSKLVNQKRELVSSVVELVQSLELISGLLVASAENELHEGLTSGFARKEAKGSQRSGKKSRSKGRGKKRRARRISKATFASSRGVAAKPRGLIVVPEEKFVAIPEPELGETEELIDIEVASAPIKMTPHQAMAALLDGARRVNLGSIAGSVDVDLRKRVRWSAHRTIQMRGQQLGRLLARTAKAGCVDRDEALRMVDGCRRLLEGALLLAVARYPILQGERHVLAIHAESHSGLPQWGHDLRVPARLLRVAGTILPDYVKRALARDYAVVGRLAHANRQVNYPVSAIRRGYHKATRGSQQLQQLLGALEKGTTNQLEQEVVGPTLRLVSALLDETKQGSQKHQDIGTAISKWMEESCAQERRLGQATKLPQSPALKATRPTREPRRFIQVSNAEQAVDAVEHVSALICLAQTIPVIGNDRARQRERNIYLQDAASHLGNLKLNLLRKSNSPEDCWAALHQTVRALRAANVAALLHYPFVDVEGHTHIVYMMDSEEKGRSLAYTSDIPLLNGYLQQVASVPDLSKELGWLKWGHRMLNNPAYQLQQPKDKQFGKVLVGLSESTEALWEARELPSGFITMVNGEGVRPEQLLAIAQQKVQEAKRSHLYPALEALVGTLGAAFSPSASRKPSTLFDVSSLCSRGH